MNLQRGHTVRSDRIGWDALAAQYRHTTASPTGANGRRDRIGQAFNSRCSAATSAQAEPRIEGRARTSVSAATRSSPSSQANPASNGPVSSKCAVSPVSETAPEFTPVPGGEIETHSCGSARKHWALDDAQNQETGLGKRRILQATFPSSGPMMTLISE